LIDLLLAGLAAGTAVAAYAAVIEPQMLLLRRHTIPLPAWRGAPLRVGVLADIHAALPQMSCARVARIGRRLLAERPELVLLPGDFVTTRNPSVRKLRVEPVVAALAELAAAVPTFAVLGNHDWHYGGGQVTRALEATGITVLANAAARLELAGGPLWIAGIDDMFTGHDDLRRALEGVDGEDPLVLLSHVPDIFPHVPPGVALTVAGHTHGGQVRIPFYGPIRTLSRLPRRMAYGLHEHEGRHLYVSGGVGVSNVPVRFACPPEIAILTLTGTAA
jgi:predicted MPP superfamily phosphohydrolase